jgi:hypothetical protein
MASEADVLLWPLVSELSSVQLVWRMLGAVGWSGSSVSFPPAPREPGIYLIKVVLGAKYRIYIGEAEKLDGRLRRNGGRAVEKPNERGKTTANMRGRINRTCRAGGHAVVYLLDLPVKQLPEREALDARCKDCRIALERLALSTAYLRGEPLINEHGFPEYPTGDPLQ